MTQLKDVAIEKTSADDGDYLVLQNPATKETYKITKANFLKGVTTSSSNSSGSSGSNGVARNYVSNGDANGVFYYLGTIFGNTTWSNPANTNRLTVSASSVESGTVESLTDRSDSTFYSNINAGNWVQFSLGSSKLKCNYYSIKTRNTSDGYFPRNWKLQGSNDGSSWDDLDIQVNNTSLTNDSQWLSLPVSSAVQYSTFRILSTGVTSSGYNYLVLGEVELYGQFFA